MPATLERVTPPEGARNLILITLDSCRFDTFMEAKTPTLAKLGQAELRYSYASWTAPSHYNLLLGLLPHESPTGVFPAAYYAKQFKHYEERLGFPIVSPERLMEMIYLPAVLQRLGYRTGALVSMSSLNPDSPLNRGFDTYRLMAQHNDMRKMIAELEFPPDRPCFWLLNVGETHYPYALASDDSAAWPRLAGAGRIMREMMQGRVFSTPAFFDDRQMAMLRARQVRAIEHLDGVFEELFDLVPKNTWICVMSDHGELFGEAGYFGHGPINHPKVFEVPFLEGLLR